MTVGAARPIRTRGAFLRSLCAALFDEATATRYLVPAIADLQHETQDGASQRRFARFATSLSGYLGFWKVFAFCAVSIRRPQGSFARPLGAAVASAMAMTALLIHGPISRDSRLVGADPWLLLLLVPQALPVAWGLSAAVFGLTQRADAGRFRTTIVYSLAVALAVCAVLEFVVPASNQAYRVRALRLAAQRSNTPTAPPQVPRKGAAEMRIDELQAAIQAAPAGDVGTRARLEYYVHQTVTLPAAAVALGLMSIALSRKHAKRDRPVWLAIGLSFVVLFVYYVPFFLGRSMALDGAIPVWLGAWGPPALFASAALAVGFARVAAASRAHAD